MEAGMDEKVSSMSQSCKQQQRVLTAVPDFSLVHLYDTDEL